MFQIPLATSSTLISKEQFWDAVILYTNRPHLANRKIIAASESLFYEINFRSKSIELLELITRPAVLYELRQLNQISLENLNEKFIKNLFESYDKNLQLTEVFVDCIKDYLKGIFISVRVVYPRLRNCPKAIEIVTFDREHNRAVFLAASDGEKHSIAPPFAYQIELTSTMNLRINVNSFEDADTTHAEWLADKLFDKLLKWVENENKQGIQSLSLIKVDEYCLTYNRLKDKYGEKLVKEWPNKTSTDPQKYVFEDIAIASYLICLWKHESNIKFVDCGCGNGLLVFLLNQEGFEGYGLDVRRRPIWDIYPKSVRLEVETVGPESVFPNCSWIIGNHSDELTPWIPILASKSGPATNFFVLPCCPYDFNGQKFIRKNTAISAYADYLHYIEDISNKCGFKTNIDKLRIPSTKRVCLVGKRLDLDNDTFSDTLTQILSFVETKVSKNIVQRAATERVRNCTQIGKELITDIVKMCVQKLLMKEQYIQKSNGDLWNKGSEMRIPDLVQEIPKESLKKLKQECGGLQTLLKNYRYIFEVYHGSVKIRLPISIEDEHKYKDKPCWFLKNHPNGCLYDKLTCGYCHE